MWNKKVAVTHVTGLLFFNHFIPFQATFLVYRFLPVFSFHFCSILTSLFKLLSILTLYSIFLQNSLSATSHIPPSNLNHLTLQCLYFQLYKTRFLPIPFSSANITFVFHSPHILSDSASLSSLTSRSLTHATFLPTIRLTPPLAL